jgi:hypothetical protein
MRIWQCTICQYAIVLSIGRETMLKKTSRQSQLRRITCVAGERFPEPVLGISLKALRLMPSTNQASPINEMRRDGI